MKYQKGESEAGCSISIVWLVAIFYAFAKWGFLHGLLNIFFPYALPIDIAKYLILHL